MKNIIKGIGVAFGCLCIVSCSDLSFGNKFLGEQPESSGATLEEMFSTKENSETVLTKAYTGLMYGLSVTGENRMGGNVLEALTDLCQSFRENAGDGPTQLYYSGALSAANIDADTRAAYVYGKQTDWTTIRYAWIYIENIDKVPDISSTDKKIRVAEAKTLIALSYFRMMRYVGGVSWLDHSVEANEAMQFPRLTFAETISKIVALLNDAIPDLVWKQDNLNDGRMTKAGAMALKFQVLLWAASPSFNSATKWHPAADEYTCYGNYDVQRWKDAETAGYNFFEEVKRQGSYKLILPDEATHKARRLAYRKAYYDRGGSEVLISIRKGYDPSIHSPILDQRYYSGPTLNYVNMFPWDNGSDFPSDFDWKNPSRQPFFTAGDMIPTRDPRLYENVACPGDAYVDGNPAPTYTNSNNYKTGSGFMNMKFILQYSEDRTGRPVQWPYLRLPDVMLGYAEVLNELNKDQGGPTSQAYAMVNEVRNRVGLSELPDKLNYTQFLEAVLKERALELGFEEVRWFDLVRRNRVQDFTKQLYGLRSKGNDINHPTSFTFDTYTINKRFWATNWDTRWYLAPIPQNEINKKYGMTQNPGW